jgi:hypothetical protein
MAYAVPLVLTQVLVLYGLNRWDIFRSFLSPQAWEFGQTHMVSSLPFTVGSIVVVRALLLLVAVVKTVWGIWRPPDGALTRTDSDG